MKLVSILLPLVLVASSPLDSISAYGQSTQESSVDQQPHYVVPLRAIRPLWRPFVLSNLRPVRGRYRFEPLGQRQQAESSIQPQVRVRYIWQVQPYRYGRMTP